MSIGRAISVLAEEKNISKYRISKNSGISQVTLSDIVNERNTNPTIETIEKIANGIGIPASEIIRKAEELG